MYNNTKLIYFDNPLKIKIKSTKEISYEYLFNLDDDKLTFIGGLEIIDKNKLEDLETFNIINLKNCFLLYSYYYQISYCHYMTQTIPKLYDYLINYRNFTLLIPKIFYNNLCKDILNILKITNIYILEEHNIYNIENLITIPHYNAPPSNFTKQHIYIYKLIRNNININENNENNRLVYLKRDGVPNKDYGNSETGLLRKIINEEELISYLKKLNFEIISLGDKSITEKYNLLKDSKVIISPLGANCLNLIFSNCPNHLIILSNDTNFGYDYYVNILETLTNKKVNSILIKSNVIYNNDILNRWNGSFNVDLNKLNSILLKLI
jgi:capsular polysaccharide biosynthesis protein